MKRILCILSSLDAGGAETFLMKINRALQPEDYQMDFIVSVDGGFCVGLKSVNVVVGYNDFVVNIELANGEIFKEK